MDGQDFIDIKENQFYNKGALRILKQTGKRVSMPRDKGRGASLPGKRVSKSGNIYYESRKNRTDNLGSRL